LREDTTIKNFSVIKKFEKKCKEETYYIIIKTRGRSSLSADFYVNFC